MEKSIFQIPFRVYRRYNFYRKSQFRTREQIENFQDEKLKQLILHAGTYVPYYRELFKKIGLNIDKFRGRIDMKKIPYLDKQTVRTNIDELKADNSAKYGVTWDSTSGSTGTPLHFILDNSVQANKIAALLRSFFWANYKIGKRTLSVQSYYFPDSDYKFNPFYNILRFDSNRLSADSALQLVGEINRKKPKFFMGFPFDLVMIAKFAQEVGREIHSPDSIVTYGETLSDEKRKLLERSYRCKVFDFFSMHECSAMISECEHGNLHLIEDFAFHEITEGGSKDGNGTLIGTSFYNYSMPLIRYKIGDTIIPDASDNACKCGRNFRTIKKILGKQCDHIETPDGRILGAVMSHSIDNAKGVICSQLIQKSINEIEVKIVTDNSYDSKSQQNLEKGLRKRVGKKIGLNFKQVSELEKSQSGKTPFIISGIGNKYI